MFAEEARRDLGGAEVTTQGMIQSALTLVPYYFFDSIKGTVKVSKPNFVRATRGSAWKWSHSQAQMFAHVHMVSSRCAPLRQSTERSQGKYGVAFSLRSSLEEFCAFFSVRGAFQGV